jgi:methionine salvage enolase-phosphatase E1
MKPTSRQLNKPAVVGFVRYHQLYMDIGGVPQAEASTAFLLNASTCYDTRSSSLRSHPKNSWFQEISRGIGKGLKGTILNVLTLTHGLNSKTSRCKELTQILWLQGYEQSEQLCHMHPLITWNTSRSVLSLEKVIHDDLAVFHSNSVYDQRRI